MNNDTPKVRMVDASGNTTEINDSRAGLLVPDEDGAVYVQQEVVAEFERAGFRVAPLSQSRRIALVNDAIADLDDSPVKTALKAAIVETQLRMWNSRRPTAA